MKTKTPSLAAAAKIAAKEQPPLHAGGTLKPTPVESLHAAPLARFIPDRKSQAAGEPPELVVTHIKYQPGGKRPEKASKKVPLKGTVRLVSREPAHLATLKDAARIAAAAASSAAWGEWRAVRIRKEGELVQLAAGDGKGLFVRLFVGEGPAKIQVGPDVDHYVPAARLHQILDAADGVQDWKLLRVESGRKEDPWEITLRGTIEDQLSIHQDLPTAGKGDGWPADGSDLGTVLGTVRGRELREALRRGGWLHEGEARKGDDAAPQPLPLLAGDDAPEWNYGLVRLTLQARTARGKAAPSLRVEGAGKSSHVSASIPADLAADAPEWRQGLERLSMVFTLRSAKQLAAWLADGPDCTIEATDAGATFSQPHAEITLPFARGRFPPVEERPPQLRNPIHVSLRVDELRNRVELACLGLSELRTDLRLEIAPGPSTLTLYAPVGGRTKVKIRLKPEAWDRQAPGFGFINVDGRRLAEALSKLERNDVVRIGVAGPTDPLVLTADGGRWTFQTRGLTFDQVGPETFQLQAPKRNP